MKQEVKYNRIIDFIRILYTVESEKPYDNEEDMMKDVNTLIENIKYWKEKNAKG